MTPKKLEEKNTKFAKAFSSGKEEGVTPKTGGPVFPVVWVDSEGYSNVHNGASLRDYFAAKAMQVFTADDYCSYERVAEMAYKQADAMLIERDKKIVQPTTNPT